MGRWGEGGGANLVSTKIKQSFHAHSTRHLSRHVALRIQDHIYTVTTEYKILASRVIIIENHGFFLCSYSVNNSFINCIDILSNSTSCRGIPF